MGWLPNRLPTVPGTGPVWLYNEVPACQVLPWRGSKEVRALADPELGMPATFSIPRTNDLERAMTAVMIGVDPHKGSHTAVVISPAEEPLGEIRVRASAAPPGARRVRCPRTRRTSRRQESKMNWRSILRRGTEITRIR